MSRYWEEMRYEQPDTGKLKKNAADTAKRAKSKGKTLEPVIITGRAITTTWWGNAWCENLEKYADFSSRIDRGKRYVKTGTVVDLKIEKGKVTAKVQGRRKTPYKIEIRISPMSEFRCQEIIGLCGNRIANLEELLSGNLPEELKNVFTGEEGLFPKPQEISFNCSCPDWALMCKHVAAALYGIGARFDKEPLLFFKLRGIDVDRFISVTLESKVESMLKNVNTASPRILREDCIGELFGI